MGAHLEDFTQSQHCAECKNKAAFVDLALVDQILTLRRPVKEIWDICLCKREYMGPVFCCNSPWACLNSLLSLPPNHGHMAVLDPQHTPAGDVPCSPALSDSQLWRRVRVSWPPSEQGGGQLLWG